MRIHSKIFSLSWWHIYHLTANKILYLMIYFVFKRSSSICHIVPSSISKTTNSFWNILGSTYWLQSIRKNDTRNFCLFVYLWSYNDKSKFSLLQKVQSSRNTSYLQTSHFCAKTEYRFLALIFLYALKKIQRKNHVWFWKRNLKVHPSRPKIRFREYQI